jgi:putative peptide zinc metalloprotease protein
MRMSPFQNDGKTARLFLVEAGARSFLVNAKASILLEALSHSGETEDVISFVKSRTAAAISPEDLMASIARLPRELFDAKLALKAATSIRYRLVLVPASLVARLAIPLIALFSAPAVSVVVAASIVAAPFSYLAAQDSFVTSSSAWDAPWVFVVGFFVSALIHELGHATAMARYGVAPGHIGCGLYWFFPALYTDVNGAWRLPPKGRVVVDSGGIYFQALLIVFLTPLAFLGVGTEPIRLLILYNLYSILHSLNPFFKMDGYWILSDLTRIPNLHRRTWRWLLRSSASDELPSRARLLVMLYALSVCAYFIYFARLIPVAIRQQLLPRLNEAAAQIPALLDACHDQAWQAAGEYLGRAIRLGLVPALSAGLFLVWVAGIVRSVLPVVCGWKRSQAWGLTR